MSSSSTAPKVDKNEHKFDRPVAPYKLEQVPGLAVSQPFSKVCSTAPKFESSKFSRQKDTRVMVLIRFTEQGPKER